MNPFELTPGLLASMERARLLYVALTGHPVTAAASPRPPIMAKVGNIERHCETVRLNSDCPYISFGCYGCSGEGPRTEERRERAAFENKLLRLPDTADGIDRMAGLAGIARAEQVELLRKRYEPRDLYHLGRALGFIP